MVTDRKAVSLDEARRIVGVSRRTLYNWMDKGLVEFKYTAGGSRRIFEDTLWSRVKPARLTLTEAAAKAGIRIEHV